VDYGDGSGSQTLALSGKTYELRHTYTDDGVFAVSVSVTDDSGGTGQGARIVTVGNVSPSVQPADDATVLEGSPFSGTGSFTDPGADGWAATVNYGDGSPSQPLLLSERTFVLDYTYLENGTFTVTVSIVDDDGGSGSGGRSVIVQNVAPVVNAGDDQEVGAGEEVHLDGSYTDPGALDTHSVLWDFGDGATAAGTLTPDHIYSIDGTYVATLTVTDDDGGVGVDTLQVVVRPEPTQTVVLYLRGSGATANPPVLFLDASEPTGSVVRYKDSAGVKFSGGNTWKEVGTWQGAPELTSGELGALSDVHLWLGLKNSDDIGTRFDLKVEAYKNDQLVTTGEVDCITNLTRNPDQAREVVLSPAPFAPVTMNGSTDVLSLRALVRIGTDGAGQMCGGHANAVGVRSYFDAAGRPARLSTTQS